MTDTPPAKSRRTKLEELVAAQPTNAFGRYGLAIECANQGDTDAAIRNFDQLLTDNPNYVTGYFQYGQFLARISRADDARRILGTGIEVAHRTGDHHAAEEMQAALSQI